MELVVASHYPVITPMVTCLKTNDKSVNYFLTVFMKCIFIIFLRTINLFTMVKTLNTHRMYEAQIS